MERGQFSRISRSDGLSARYLYDSANQRTVKQTLETVDDVLLGDGLDDYDGDPPERLTLYVYPGDVERRGLARNFTRTGYVEAEGMVGGTPVSIAETQYLVGGARVVWEPTAEPERLDGTLTKAARVTIAIPDLIGTTSAVLDLESGELVEASTYYPNGARETYVSNSSIGDEIITPEPTGFTGKEGDEEVGLTYFGERSLIPRVGRWASPDPAQVHGLGGGEVGNSYHYVAGNLLVARDPLGLSPGGDAISNAARGALSGDLEARAAEVRARFDIPPPRANGQDGWQEENAVGEGRNVAFNRQGSAGRELQVRGLLTRIRDNPGAAEHVFGQMMRATTGSDRAQRRFDASLVLSTMLLESGPQAVVADSGTVNSYRNGGLDNLDAFLKPKKGETRTDFGPRYLPSGVRGEWKRAGDPHHNDGRPPRLVQDVVFPAADQIVAYAASLDRAHDVVLNNATRIFRITATEFGRQFDGLSASQRRMLVTIAFARIETLGEVLSYLRRTRQGMGGIDSARTRERFLGSENQVYEKALVTAGQAELLDESVGGAAQTAVRGPGSGSTQVRQ